MLQNFLIDTNVLLDAILERSEAEEANDALLFLYNSENFTAWIAPHGLATTFYIARREIGKEATLEVIKRLLRQVRLAPLSEDHSLRAFDYEMNDFEDALQAASAEAINARAIITRNTKDFSNSPIPPLTPKEFLRI